MNKIIAIFGASGFVGKYIAKFAVEEGYRLKLISRFEHELRDLKVLGEVGQLSFHVLNSLDDVEQISEIIDNSYAVINLVGSIYGSSNFKYMLDSNGKYPEMLANISKECNIERFIHFSSIGAKEYSQIPYFRSKILGEKAVTCTIKNATIIRPNIIYGKNCLIARAILSFIKHFGRYPLINHGFSRVQPVYVADLARCIVSLINNEELLNRGGVYSICGDRVYTISSFIELILRSSNIKSKSINISSGAIKKIIYIFKILFKPFVKIDEESFSDSIIDLISVDLTDNTELDNLMSVLNIANTKLDNILL